MKAICINNLWSEAPWDIRTFKPIVGLTRDKEYEVTDDGTGFYVFIDDFGNENCHHKSRFRISKNNKTWMQQAMEHVEPVIREELKKAISNYMEGEKMEDKTIKVRCKYNSIRNMTLGKEYLVLKESDIAYLIENDRGFEREYSKMLFEKVEDVLMVECIDNESQEKFLTLNEKYKILEENNKGYFIIDDTGHKYLAHKSRFKLAEPQKEVKKEIVCYQKECGGNKENKCTNKLMNIGSSLVGCPIRLKEPINYEEENKKCYQESEKCPKNEKGKCTDSKMCGNQYPAGFDFELECFRLQKENEELRKEDLNKEIRLNNQGKRISADGNQIQKLFQEIEKQKADNEKLRQANATNLDEYEEHLKILKEELERENLGLKDKLETIDDEYQIELEELKQKISDMDNERKYLKSEILRYEQEIKEWNEGAVCNNRVLEKLTKESKELKATVKTLASML